MPQRLLDSASGSPAPLQMDGIPRLAAEATRPAHFYVGPDLPLEWEHVAEETISWEVFRGRLSRPGPHAAAPDLRGVERLPVGAGRPIRRPLLSVKWDAAAGRLYVVRGIDSYVWEGYDSGGGVILSRERRKWVRELVGAIAVTEFADAEEVHDELICLLFHAVVGTSRLPLTSVEAPLPAFSFGQLLYCHGIGGPGDGPVRSEVSLWTHLVAPFSESAGARQAAGGVSACRTRGGRGRGVLGVVPPWDASPDFSALLRDLFNEASLSPYTGLGEKTVALLDVAGTIPIRIRRRTPWTSWAGCCCRSAGT